MGETKRLGYLDSHPSFAFDEWREPKRCQTWWARIFMAGDIHQAAHELQKYCSHYPSCFSLTATDYIYSGGRESGFVVGLIAYPRFPKSEPQLAHDARLVAGHLAEVLGQGSYTIMMPERTEFYSRRKGEDSHDPN